MNQMAHGRPKAGDPESNDTRQPLKEATSGVAKRTSLASQLHSLESPTSLGVVRPTGPSTAVVRFEGEGAAGRAATSPARRQASPPADERRQKTRRSTPACDRLRRQGPDRARAGTQWGLQSGCGGIRPRTAEPDQRRLQVPISTDTAATSGYSIFFFSFSISNGRCTHGQKGSGNEGVGHGGDPGAA